ncbi:translesion error-prone DNA polymerase V autoproteolytic subunit (plasmid) [Flagellimonas marinaquae]|nr:MULTISPECIES: translesion error-prone DNA polymerase V autoproteolytic subunit [Flavobacteriaceae]USD27034.1 translesion error-prone DNA polymerase V autoproteolytic subunit [Allomuricauda aquimarina]
MGNPLGLPYFDGGVSAGFPSPADDFKEDRISLDRELVRDTEATFFARVNGDSMQGAGMDDGDLLVIDKSIEAYDGCIAVCFVDGEFTVKRVQKEKDRIVLMPENPKYRPIEISGENSLVIWGVVTYVVKKLHFKNQHI